MEQQSISISKAGIVTSLAARCSVIAAANPIGGKYDSSRTFGQNVELTEPILSRFDVLLVIKDLVDPVLDEQLAYFVVSSHQRSHPSQLHSSDATDGTGHFAVDEKGDDPEVIPQDLLRKYITYARQNVFPRMHDADADKIALVYADLRRQASQGQGVPMAVRHVESMIRMAEAHARMHLRQFVTDDDVDTAIRVLLQSFIGTQKYGVQKALEKSFRRYMTHRRDFNLLLLHLLRQLLREALRLRDLGWRAASGGRDDVVEVKLEDLEAKAREYGINDLRWFLGSRHFVHNHFTLDETNRLILHPVV
eukprot:TRINITY_DN9005_c0_g1_i1.p1 TRINITY_DN9005_c0_g1~~TRINITY_DN9005_c0_g1_i1.p1  ORF type:complete len:324 (-),score=27.02 TRINITY_DN9005_c0_g1_i1:171-1091(-)